MTRTTGTKSDKEEERKVVKDHLSRICVTRPETLCFCSVTTTYEKLDHPFSLLEFCYTVHDIVSTPVLQGDYFFLGDHHDITVFFIKVSST